MLKLDPIEFRSPIATVEFSNGRKLPLLLESVWQRRFANWFAVLLGLGQRQTLTANITFPPCPPQSSVDVNVPFPGAVPAASSGEPAQSVVIGLSSNVFFTVNTMFQASVTAIDVVTVREVCVDAFGVGGFTDTFTLMLWS